MIFVIIVFSTLLYGAVDPAVIAATYLLVGVMLALTIGDWLKAGHISLSREPIQLLLFAAAAYGIVQVVPFGSEAVAGVDGISRTISFDPFATRVAALHFAILGIYLALVLVAFNSASRLRNFGIFITIFGFAFAFFSVIQSILSPTSIYGILSAADPMGTFVSRNNFAMWMEMAAAVPLGLLFSGTIDRDKRLLYGTAAVLMAISMVVSGSRGALVVLLVQLGFLFLVTHSKGSRGQVWPRALMIVGLVIAIIVGTVFVGGETSLTRIGQEESQSVEAISRQKMWSVTVKMIADNLPFGVGWGAFGIAYTKYDVASGFYRVEQAHNDLLQIVSDGGLVGLILGILFLIFLYRLGRRALRATNAFRRGLAAGALAGIFGVLVHSLFDFGLHTASIALLFLTFIGVLAACGSTFEDDIETDGRERHRSRRHRRGA